MRTAGHAIATHHGRLRGACCEDGIACQVADESGDNLHAMSACTPQRPLVLKRATLAINEGR